MTQTQSMTERGQPASDGNGWEPEIMVLRVQLASAVDKNRAALHELGIVTRLLSAWMERRHPGMWGRLRLRMGVSEAVAAVLETLGEQDQSAANAVSAPSERLIAPADAPPILTCPVPADPAFFEFLREASHNGQTLLQALQHWDAAQSAGGELDRPGTQLSVIPQPAGQGAEGVVEGKMSVSLPDPLGEWERIVLQALGAGACFDGQLSAHVPDDLRQTNAPDSLRRRLDDAMARLSAQGALEVSSLDLGVSNEVLPLLEGQRALRLTAAGVGLHRAEFGAAPALARSRLRPNDTEQADVPPVWARAMANYRSLESFVLVRGVKRAILAATVAGGPSPWHTQVFDLMDSDDVTQLENDPDYAKLLAAQGRSFQTRWSDGEGGEAVPDLVVVMQPRLGGVGMAMLVEVERARYSRQGMIEKLRASIRCYPPLQFCYVFPSAQIAGKIFALFKEEALDPEVRMRGLPHGCKALFTDFRRVAQGTWLSVEQVHRATLALRAGNTEAPAAKGINPRMLPSYWMSEAKRKPFDAQQGGEGKDATTPH